MLLPLVRTQILRGLHYLRSIRCILIIALAASVVPQTAAGQEKAMRILYTGSLNGELEPCGCSPKTDFGGLARTSGYILKNRNALLPYILVDAGNFAPEDSPQGRLKAEVLLKAFRIMQYDAVAFLKNEKAFPDEFFASLIQQHKVPFVSDAYPCERSVAVSYASVDFNVSSRQDDLKEEKLNILLTDKPASVAKEITGWDVIISSSGEVMDEPLKANDTIIVSGYPRGKKLGILTLYLGSAGKVKKYTHRFEAIGNDITEDALIRNVLNEYDTQVAALLAASAVPPAGATYLGVAKCAECHAPFVESWEKTEHAGAIRSLEKVGKAADPECLFCHTVGFGEEGGFHTMETTPELANVQCEECHGLDRAHIDDFSRPMRTVTEAVCVKCHTKENSPDFDYPVYLEKINH